MPLPDSLPSYSLTTPPYDTSALDPLTVSVHAKWLVEVAGANVGAMATKLKTAAAPGSAEKPLFVLVKGPQNCGLSSVANHVLAEYASLRGIAPGDFIVPDRTAETAGVDEYTIWLNWLGLLQDEVDTRHLGVSAKLMEQFSSALTTAQPGKLAVQFRPLVRKMSAELASLTNAPSGYGVCLENPKHSDILETAFQMFSSTRTICVFIVGEYADGREKVIAHFEDKSGVDKMVIPLSTLDGSQAEYLLRERWKRVNSLIADPFDPGAIEVAFSDRRRPVKRVMILINKVLRHKAIVECPTKIWPGHTDLAFHADDLKNRITILEDEALGDAGR